jgi:putative acetyltransferase
MFGTESAFAKQLGHSSQTSSPSGSICTEVNVVIQRLQSSDTRAYLEVRRAAIRATAVRDYPPDVIEAWASFPITDSAVEATLANPDGEIWVGAVLGNALVGVGAVVPRLRELRACYVLPEKGGTGVGRMIVAELEMIARAEGAPFLIVESSLTALSFYTALGYQVLRRGEHVLGSGVAMAAVIMRKRL